MKIRVPNTMPDISDNSSNIPLSENIAIPVTGTNI